jgi:hypothetical protein
MIICFSILKLAATVIMELGSDSQTKSLNVSVIELGSDSKTKSLNVSVIIELGSDSKTKSLNVSVHNRNSLPICLFSIYI